jgi:hypothetical protein
MVPVGNRARPLTTEDEARKGHVSRRAAESGLAVRLNHTVLPTPRRERYREDVKRFRLGVKLLVGGDDGFRAIVETLAGAAQNLIHGHLLIFRLVDTVGQLVEHRAHKERHTRRDRRSKGAERLQRQDAAVGCSRALCQEKSAEIMKFTGIVSQTAKRAAGRALYEEKLSAFVAQVVPAAFAERPEAFATCF